jgi:hypothetical protein
MVRPFLISILAVSALSVAGCGTSAAGLCGDVCECTGCSEREEEECVDDVEDQQKAAADEGCEDQYDALLSCYGDQLECRDSELDVDGCDSEEEELSKCAGGGVGGIGGSRCDRAAAICAAEAGVENGGSGGECSGATACVADCIVESNSCDTTDEGLIGCISDCSGGSTGPEGDE